MGEEPDVLEAPTASRSRRSPRCGPDLIVGTNAGMQKKDYDKLSLIAPTVAGVKGGTDYFSPWDQQTVLIAQALGQEERGPQARRRHQGEYAEVAADHPEWKGKTATFSQGGFYDGLIYVYPPGLNTEFLSYLGFEINPKLTPLVEKAGEQVTVSAERLDVLDADSPCSRPRARTRREAEKGADVRQAAASWPRAARSTPTATLAGAIYFISPLSLPYVLEHLTPQLEAAFDRARHRPAVLRTDRRSGDSSAAAASDRPRRSPSRPRSSTSTARRRSRAAPKRVVVAGLREQDSLLALGVVPVATTEWFGTTPGRSSPGPGTSSATRRCPRCSTTPMASRSKGSPPSDRT